MAQTSIRWGLLVGGICFLALVRSSCAADSGWPDDELERPNDNVEISLYVGSPFQVSGLGGTKLASKQIQLLVQKLRPEIEEKVGPFREIAAISYRAQIVAGVNYIVKVRLTSAAGDKYAHLLIHEPLAQTKGNPILVACKKNLRLDSPIEAFASSAPGLVSRLNSSAASIEIDFQSRSSQIPSAEPEPDAELGPVLAATEPVKLLARSLKHELRQSFPEGIISIQPISYRLRTGSGRLFFIKTIVIDADDRLKYVHLRVHQQLGELAPARLEAVLTNVDGDTPLEYFAATPQIEYDPDDGPMWPTPMPSPPLQLFPQPPPPAGQIPPPAGQIPPPAGQIPPPAGQIPPPAGQIPPPAGQIPPPAGQIPPPSLLPGAPTDKLRGLLNRVATCFQQMYRYEFDSFQPISFISRLEPAASQTRIDLVKVEFVNWRQQKSYVHELISEQNDNCVSLVFADLDVTASTPLVFPDVVLPVGEDLKPREPDERLKYVMVHANAQVRRAVPQYFVVITPLKYILRVWGKKDGFASERQSYVVKVELVEQGGAKRYAHIHLSWAEGQEPSVDYVDYQVTFDSPLKYRPGARLRMGRARAGRARRRASSCYGPCCPQCLSAKAHAGRWKASAIGDGSRSLWRRRKGAASRARSAIGED